MLNKLSAKNILVKKSHIDYINMDSFIEEYQTSGFKVKKYIKEFWPAKQRGSNSLHEVSYRACFKPELPRYFIELLTKENDIVYDPFTGRGTSIIEAALLNRNIISNDVNPLSKILCSPRLNPPKILDIEKRLNEITVLSSIKSEIDLSMFYHEKTLIELLSLKHHILEKEKSNTLDNIDNWIRMVATNRLTGHSKNFFSVYTLPPNQAVSATRQVKINKIRNQAPEYKNIFEIILIKSKSLLKNVTKEQEEMLKQASTNGYFFCDDASLTKSIPTNSVSLTVTSPPFLNVIQYAQDNWLRCWFNGIDASDIGKKITVTKDINKWSNFMSQVLTELLRITKPDGYVAMEVGEVDKGKIKLDEVITDIGINVGFNSEGICINKQTFTKTAMIWGIANNKNGTNTNRIVLLRKPK